MVFQFCYVMFICVRITSCAIWMDNDLLKISTWNMQHFGLENADFCIQNLNIFAIQPQRSDCWTRFGKNNKKCPVNLICWKGLSFISKVLTEQTMLDISISSLCIEVKILIQHLHSHSFIPKWTLQIPQPY